MSMISEQVKELRNIYKYGTTYERTKQAVNEAADTIEALSAKVASANMGRSYVYYGDKKLKLSDLKDIISKDSEVGIAAPDYDDLPIVDT